MKRVNVLLDALINEDPAMREESESLPSTGGCCSAKIPITTRKYRRKESGKVDWLALFAISLREGRTEALSDAIAPPSPNIFNS